jgi:calcineurin-like phosphoesterase family protein
MKYAISSDQHHFHSNIIKYQNRPFKDASEMNEVLIKNWNLKCDHDTVVYCLGVGGQHGESLVGSIISRLNFRHMHFITGNHDNAFLRWFANNKPHNITLYGSYLETKIEKQTITFSHYPVLSWNKKSHGSWMLHGHCHYNLVASRKESKMIGKILDVGVDGNNYMPYTLDEISDIMKQKPITGTALEFSDHHD